jgi:hypothetical protein
MEIFREKTLLNLLIKTTFLVKTNVFQSKFGKKFPEIWMMLICMLVALQRLMFVVGRY